MGTLRKALSQDEFAGQCTQVRAQCTSLQEKGRFLSLQAKICWDPGYNE